MDAIYDFKSGGSCNNLSTMSNIGYGSVTGVLHLGNKA